MAAFCGSTSSSLRLLETQPAMGLRHRHQDTTNRVSLAPLLGLLTLSVIAIPPTEVSSNCHRTPFSRALRRAHNSGPLTAFNRSNAHRAPINNRLAEPCLRKVASNTNRRAVTASLTEQEVAVAGEKVKTACLLPPSGQSAAKQLTQKNASEKAFLPDLTNMLHHAPAASYIQLEEHSNSWPLGGATATPTPNFGLLDKGWRRNGGQRKETLNKESARVQADIALLQNLERTFNPFLDSIQKFIDIALTILFESKGLSGADIYQLIPAFYQDERPVNAPYAHLQPTQAKAIPYQANWSIKEIVTGAIFPEMEINAGAVTAHMEDVTFYWPDNFPLDLQQALTDGWLWRVFSRYIAINLTAGPRVEQTKKNIRAYLNAQFSHIYAGSRTDADAALKHFLDNGREVKYKDEIVAGLVMTPATTKGGNGVLYFMNQHIAPIIVPDVTFALDDVKLRDVVRNGLREKTIIKFGANLFTKRWSFPPHSLLSPSLTFGASGRVDDILWSAAIEKMRSDMDLEVLSRNEKTAMFATGLAKIGFKVVFVVFAPSMGPLLSLGAGLLSTFPDAVMAMITDHPEEAQAHLTNFFVGVAIESVGMAFFLGHKGAFLRRATKTTNKIRSKPGTREAEEGSLKDWAKNFKIYTNLPPQEKFSYLAQNAIEEYSGFVAKKLTEKASSWDFIGRLERHAGLISYKQLQDLSADTNVQDASPFLGNMPFQVTTRKKFLALPSCSRIAFINTQGELKHTMAKLDHGIAIGYKNAIFGADINGVEALDLSDALKWSVDGLASISIEGESYKVLAKPAPIPPHDEKKPAMRAKRPLQITHYFAPIWKRITNAETNAETSSRSLQNPEFWPNVVYAGGTGTSRVIGTEPNAGSDQLPGDAIDFGEFVEVPNYNCDAVCSEEKITLACVTLLSRLFNLSIEEAKALEIDLARSVHDALTQPSLHMPEVEWGNLPLQARKMVEVKYILRAQDSTITLSHAAGLASACYAQPLNPYTFDRAYFDALMSLVRPLAEDPALAATMRARPSVALSNHLLVDSLEEINVFINNFRAHNIFNITGPYDALENPVSAALRTNLMDYSYEKARVFLHDFQLHHLPLPGKFDHMAMLYYCLQQKDTGQLNAFDHAQNAVGQLRANYKRALGLDQAKPKLVAAVLRALDFNGMTLSGSYGLTLRDFSSRTELHKLFEVFNYKERLTLLEEVRSQTGFSLHYPIGTLEAAVDKMLTLFPNGNDLTAAAQDGDIDVLFTQLVTLQLALENGVTRANPAKMTALWEDLLAHRPFVSGLTHWMADLEQKYPLATFECMIAAANGMYDIAKKRDGSGDGSGNNPTALALRNFAKKIVRTGLRDPVIGGSTSAAMRLSMQAYIDRYLNGVPVPTSIQGWSDWLRAQTTYQIQPHAPATAIPRQKYINAPREYALQWLGTSEKIPTLSGLFGPAADDLVAKFGSAEQRFLEDGGLLVRSGFMHHQKFLNGSAFTLAQIAIEGWVTTIFQRDTAYYVDNFLGNPDFMYAQMMAKDAFTGEYYSNRCPKGQKGASLVVAGRIMSDVPSIALLTRIQADLTDFSNRNGTRICHNIFKIQATDLARIAHDPCAVFTTIYNKSGLFRALVQAAETRIGKWIVLFGQTPHLENRAKFLFLPWDQQWQYLRKDFDITGTAQPISAPRMYLQLWIDIFLQQRAAPASDQNEQSLSIMLTNIILDQSELLTYERLSSAQPAAPLPLPERLRQFSIRHWENRYAEALLSDIVPPGDRKAVFFSCAHETLSVTKTIAHLSSLPSPPYVFPPLNTIRVESKENSRLYQENMLRIYLQQFGNEGICAQLMTKFGARISAKHPWRIRYVDRDAQPEIFGPFSASVRVNQESRIAYLADPILFPSYFPTVDGMAPMCHTRQLTIVLLKILTAAPDIEGELACDHRDEITPLTDMVLKELNYKSPLAIAAATIDSSNTKTSLRLLRNMFSVARRNQDKNKLLSDGLWRHYGFDSD